MSRSVTQKEPTTARSLARAPKNCGGFTLIEVLVTVVILAVGLLGLAGMQAASMRNNHSAYLRSQAVQLSYDMADRVRSNTEYRGLFDGLGAKETANCETTTGCTAKDMAQNDVFQWEREIAAILPAGDSIICLDATPADGLSSSDAECDGSGTSYAVKVWWNDARDGGAAQRFVMSFRP